VPGVRIRRLGRGHGGPKEGEYGENEDAHGFRVQDGALCA